MNVVADENIPKRTVVALRAQGHVVTDVRESPHRGASDERIWALAQRERALLVTTDKGFVRRSVPRHHGILVIRLRQPNRERIHQRVMHAVAHFSDLSWPGQTVVLRDRAQSVRRNRPGDP